MIRTTRDFHFVGTGNTKELEASIAKIKPWNNGIGPWKRRRGDEGVPDNDERPPEHPANYSAAPGLADAVNTAIALNKPLLVTGNPGTGKSQLAERIAWEFNLGPLLRFEAQSLSEANDIFYRFDLVGYLAAVELLKSIPSVPRPDTDAAEPLLGSQTASADRFLKLGPLGEAIVRSNPGTHERLFKAVFPEELANGQVTATARPSVVLVDEIDKASRDFPNDLLNGIERLEFAIRELGIESVHANEAYPPIVIITSNSERDLPAAFLRRCTFFHIEDPTPDQLEAILARKFFAQPDTEGKPRKELPSFYQQLVGTFVKYRELHANTLHYAPGTSELIDWTRALKDKVPTNAEFGSQLDVVRQTASTIAKHRDDLKSLKTFLQGYAPQKT